MPRRDPTLNPLFVGRGSPYGLGLMLRAWGGAPLQAVPLYNDSLVAAFKCHLETTGLNNRIRDFAAVIEWSKTADASAFFDRCILGNE